MVKLYHCAAKIRDDGAVSALCFRTPHPIDLRRSCWTLLDRHITCPKCRKMRVAAKSASSDEVEEPVRSAEGAEPQP